MRSFNARQINGTSKNKGSHSSPRKSRVKTLRANPASRQGGWLWAGNMPAAPSPTTRSASASTRTANILDQYRPVTGYTVIAPSSRAISAQEPPPPAPRERRWGADPTALHTWPNLVHGARKGWRVLQCFKLGTLGKFPRGARLEYTALKGVQGPSPPLPFRGRKFLGHAKIKHFPIVSGSKLAAGLSFLPTPA